jgi:arylsulfatase A
MPTPFYCSLLATLALSLAVLPLFVVHAQDPAKTSTNVIIIFTDDQGYQDLGCYGSPTLRTPHIDRLASEGVRLTDFYVAANVCTPSRAALLTGCYPKRVGMHRGVLFEHSPTGLATDEITIADMLKKKGYATACVGKWHLGHKTPFLPLAQGFDSYFGIPYSNDMAADPTMALATDVQLGNNLTREQFAAMTLDDFRKKYKNDVPLMRGNEVIEYPVDQRFITRRYTEEAISFITKNKEKPFFLYLAHTMPHVPLFSPPERQGTSQGGPYGDAIEEIDWSTGAIVDTLRQLKLDKNTLVIFTSDNGPWNKVQKNNGPQVTGSALPLRDSKMSTYEGGHRVPAVMWLPGQLPAGRVHAGMVIAFDLFPTIAALCGADIPTDRAIDGVNCFDYLTGEKIGDTHEAYYYYSTSGTLEAVRVGAWKLRLAVPQTAVAKKNDAMPEAKEIIELYNLRDDISEKNNRAQAEPERVAVLRKRMLDFDTELNAAARQTGKPKQE